MGTSAFRRHRESDLMMRGLVFLSCLGLAAAANFCGTNTPFDYYHQPPCDGHWQLCALPAHLCTHDQVACWSCAECPHYPPSMHAMLEKTVVTNVYSVVFMTSLLAGVIVSSALFFLWNRGQSNSV